MKNFDRTVQSTGPGGGPGDISPKSLSSILVHRSPTHDILELHTGITKIIVEVLEGLKINDVGNGWDEKMRTLQIFELF